MARSKFVESFDLAQNGNSVDEHGQHFDGDGTPPPGYGITPLQCTVVKRVSESNNN